MSGTIIIITVIILAAVIFELILSYIQNEKKRIAGMKEWREGLNIPTKTKFIYDAVEFYNEASRGYLDLHYTNYIYISRYYTEDDLALIAKNHLIGITTKNVVAQAHSNLNNKKTFDY